MKKSIASTVVICLVIAVGAVIVYKLVSKKPVDQPAVQSSQQSAAIDNGLNIQTNTVTIENHRYEPASISVKRGTTVTWTNKDGVKHDVTPDEPNEAFVASQLFGKDESYSFTFNTPGTYTYFCSPHPYMKGVVVVTE